MDQENSVPLVESDLLPTSTLAIVSLVSALFGFTFVPLIGTIVALVTGYMARNETHAIPPRASGDELATAGIVMGWIQVGLLVLGCCAVAFFVFVMGNFAATNQ